MTSIYDTSTSWRILETPRRRGLDIRLVVDTTAPTIVELIENAAENAGILLEREQTEAEQ